MDADPPNGSDDERGRAVAPEDLDITKDDHVVELQEGRYVISTGDSTEAPTTSKQHSTESRTPTELLSRNPSREELHAVGNRLLEQYAAERNERQGFSVTATIDGSVGQYERFTDDIGDAFGDFLTWYATAVDADADPAETLGILLLAADVPIRHPPRTLYEAVTANGLTRDDSVGDLLDAVREEGLHVRPTDTHE
ncbi:MAG: DUF7500 family protein [Halobacteriota archaeon]